MRSILVPEAHALGMLGAIRSLGGAGYRVHAASPQRDAIGFASRHCSARTVCPAYQSSAYVDWLRSYVSRESVSAIVPGGAFLLAIEPCFEEFQALLPIAADRDVVYRALSKIEVFEAFCAAPSELRLLHHHPPSLVITSSSPYPHAGRLAELGDRIYLKADARHGPPGTDDLLVGPLQPAQLADSLREALQTYRSVLLQGAVSGRQAGVTLLMDGSGCVLAENCFRDLHIEPTRRGTMSLRETWRNAELVADATRRLRHLGWQGSAMLEYRVNDHDGSFNFIELNPRFWQSLHLDLLSGVDFPRLQIAWFEGEHVSSSTPARHLVCRDLWPGEISRMIEIWRSSRFTFAQRLNETFAFLLRLLDLRIASDYAFPGDRKLYWRRVAQVVRGWLHI